MSAPLPIHSGEEEEVQAVEGDHVVQAPPVVVKTYKLYIHTIQFCTEDIVIRSEDFPEVHPGDILEIYHEEETFSRLLLQVKSHFHPVIFMICRAGQTRKSLSWK